MIKDNKIWFIDYQGGMQGALQYDIASLLWQARAQMPYDWRDELVWEYQNYMLRVNSVMQHGAFHYHAKSGLTN